MNYLTYANINLDNLEHNYKRIKEIAKNAKIISVVKANAYGHGAPQCAGLLYELGCRYFAVANLAEALEIRNTVPEADILILGATNPYDAGILSENDITQTVYSAEYAEALSAAATGNGCRVKTHLKIDTGMNRIGFSCDQNGISEAVGACSLPSLDMKGVYTHFSCADSAECRETAEQAKRYKKAVDEIERQNGKFEIHHLSNSAAILKYPEYHSDSVRAGIILYGLKPSDFVNDRDNVKPVMEFYSTIVHTHTVKAGEKIGYGGSYTAKTDIRAATVAAGYADGLLRGFANNGFAEIIHDSKCFSAPIIGRICMDQCVHDVTDLLDVKPGDKVRIFGLRKISADSLAERNSTIGYEVVCGIGKRVPRIFYRNDRVSETSCAI